MGFNKINDEKSVSCLSNIESVGISVSRIDHMSISQISFVLIPPRGTDEIVTVDYLQLVHLISTFSVET